MGFSIQKTIKFWIGTLGCSFLFYFSGHKVINLDLEPARTYLIKDLMIGLILMT